MNVKMEAPAYSTTSCSIIAFDVIVTQHVSGKTILLILIHRDVLLL